MNKHNYIILSVICMICGIALYLVKNKYIIFRFNSEKYEHIYSEIKKKDVLLQYWQNNEWKRESQILLWSDSKQQNIYHLVNAWLTLLNEENIMEKKVIAQTVLLAASDHDAYISFDYDPFSLQSSTFDALMLIEGLLKTIRDNNISINRIQFLVHHIPLQNVLFDFSKPWPISGFLEL